MLDGRNRHFQRLTAFPLLFTQCCHYDFYKPWSQETYSTIAEAWLQQPQSLVTHFHNNLDH